jgi:hypothetical protein
MKSKKYSNIPGDTRRVMTTDHRAKDGRTFPRGTTYQPSSAGSHGQEVVIAGEMVKF